MNTIQIDSKNIRVQESCYLFDTGSVGDVDIVIGEGLQVEYCFIASALSDISPISSSPTTSYFRHIAIGENSTFIGTGVMMNQINLEIITEIVGDNATSTLDLLALASDDARISVEGVVRVANPYRHISTRVDQTNILIGTGAHVRGVPRLEIATDDIEGGHSCRIHRLGGEALFYLTSRGLSEQDAETLLLNSEIQRHLRTIVKSEREVVYGKIYRLIKRNT